MCPRVSCVCGVQCDLEGGVGVDRATGYTLHPSRFQTADLRRKKHMAYQWITVLVFGLTMLVD